MRSVSGCRRTSVRRRAGPRRRGSGQRRDADLSRQREPDSRHHLDEERCVWVCVCVCVRVWGWVWVGVGGEAVSVCASCLHHTGLVSRKYATNDFCVCVCVCAHVCSRQTRLQVSAWRVCECVHRYMCRQLPSSDTDSFSTLLQFAQELPRDE